MTGFDNLDETERTMGEITRVGVDLGKQLFHLSAMDESGNVLERKRLRRPGFESYLAALPQGCVVAMEACGGAHHWGRMALRHGHRVLLMSPVAVKPYVGSNKNDVNDADGIAEASTRPQMRFVGVKTVAQQDLQELHRVRQMAVENRTRQCNQLHAFLLERGIESRKGVANVLERVREALEDATNELSAGGRRTLSELREELRRLDDRVKVYDAQIGAIARTEPACRRLQTIPGIGPLTATAMVAAVGDGGAFHKGRELAAWLGLVPRQHTTGGRPRLLGISKHGDRYLRTLLIHGGRAALRAAPKHDDRRARWALSVEKRRCRNIAAVALANKNARIAWALLRNETEFDAGHVATGARRTARQAA